MNKEKKGFTLAEVLITLVIIGVIAAITVPSLIQSTNKQEYVSALQKAYSTLSQVTNQIIQEEGSPEEWVDTPEHVYTLFKKHLNVLKDCGENAGCFPQKNVHRLGMISQYDEFNLDDAKKYYKIVLSDGMQIIFDSFAHKMWVDVNGSKKPNVLGRDIFILAIGENGLHPRCSSEKTQCKKDGGDGDGCACKVLREGAMNY